MGGDAEEMTRQVANAQQQAADAAQQLHDTRIFPSIAQSAEDRQSIIGMSSCLSDLEIRAEKHDGDTAQLKKLQGQRETDCQAFEVRLHELSAAEFQLEELVGKVGEEVK